MEGSQTLTSPEVQVGEDGLLHTATPEAARLIKLLGLNGKIAVEFRLLWIGIVALAAKGDPDLYRRLLGFQPIFLTCNPCCLLAATVGPTA